MKKKITIPFMALVCLSMRLTAQPVMVKDIIPGIGSPYPTYLTHVNGKAWFFGRNATNDSNFLYQSDGTPSGTQALLSMPQNTNVEVHAFGNKIIFTSSINYNNQEPWISDGTVTGTFMLKDLNPGNGSSAGKMIGSLGTTAFLAGINLGIFKTDGTSIGTSLMFSLNAFNKAISFNNMMYFWGTYNNIAGLYSFNASSTVPTLIAQHTNSIYDFALAAGSNAFYYVASTTANGYEPWVSDGTPGGTKMLMDVYSGTSSSCSDGSSGSQTSMAVLNNTLYFNPTNNTIGRELWVSNGTTAGTNLFMELVVGASSGNPGKFMAVGNQLFFEARPVSGGISDDFLWVSDGTVNGTKMLNIRMAGPKYALNSKVFFYASTDVATIGIEPYISDGTANGTVIAGDINPTPYTQSMSSNYQQLPVVIGNTVYFVADNDTNGNELWKYTDKGLVGLDQQAGFQKEIHVYPNPSHELLTIELRDMDLHSGITLELMNVAGQTIRLETIHSSTTQMELDNIPPGIYFYRLKDGLLTTLAGKIMIE